MRFLMCFAALCCIFLVLSDQYQPGAALTKKRILRRLKEFLPLLLALKGKKKLLVLPIPIPIKVRKEVKDTWPPVHAWLSHSPPHSPPMSWPSSIDLSDSWPASLPQYQPPPTKISHSYMPPQFVSDNSAVKQGIEQLVSYVMKDGPGLNYALSSGGYHPSAFSSSYGRSPYMTANNYGRARPDRDESRRVPLAPVVSKSSSKKPLFGQPLDDYENGKGTAPAYNDISNAPAKSNGRSQRPSYTSENANRIQFQNGVSADYSGGSTHIDNGSSAISVDNGYKSPNEINYEDHRLKSATGNYAGGDTNDEGTSYVEESNELISESAKDSQSTYQSNNVPAMRVAAYKKKAKV